MRLATTCALIGHLLLAEVLLAQEARPGQVQLPLEEYTRLVEASRQPSNPPQPAPASYALGNAQMSVDVARSESRAVATVTLALALDVLVDDWVLVPVLPAGTPVDAATVDGRPVQLIAGPAGLGWATRAAGAHAVRLVYRIDAVSSGAGYSLAIPVAQAASVQLTVTLPGDHLDVAVIPSAGASSTAQNGATRVTATVPTTSGVQISWRSPTGRGHALSRASYSGRLTGDAVLWTGDLAVDLFGDESITLDLLPRTVTLSSLTVDGRDAPILVENHRFVTVVRGRGTHRLTLGFQVPVVREDGPPRVELEVPEVPVSRFELTLPGRKDVTAHPASSVSSQVRGPSTVATVHVPLTRRLRLSWSEAVPDEARTDARVNAAVYHAVHAAEGVLYAHAVISFDVQRGETSSIELLLPDDVQVNRVEAEGGAVTDWRVGATRNGQRTLRVFLNRQLRGELVFDVQYDRSLTVAAPDGTLPVPLLTVAGAQRQRGMVALLSGSELALNPVEPAGGPADAGLTRVGENQLPAFVRDRMTLTVAHTFKYVEPPAGLRVAASPPAPVEARLDAQVDTLVSLGEVTLTGRAAVELNVKSGRTSGIQLEMPEGVNLLSLTAPSLRTHRTTLEAGRQVIDVEFTQEMDGLLRLEVGYERILQDTDAAIGIPTVSVRGAELEQGRIAVEALSPVEVQPVAAEQLVPVEVDELPSSSSCARRTRFCSPTNTSAPIRRIA